MNNFLETYKINSNDLEDFINIFKEDKTIQARRVDKSNLKTDLKEKKLSISCRAFIMFMTNNLHTKRNIQEIIIDKLPALPPAPIIKEKVEVIESSSSSEEEVDDDDTDDNDDDTDDDNNLLTHVEDKDGGYTEVKMDEWRERQKKIRSMGYPGMKIAPKFTKEELFESIEWTTLKDLKMIPLYTLENVKLDNCYYEGIHDDLVKIYKKLKA